MSLKKLPLLSDIRDESAEDIRLVLEPKSRTVDPALLMETLFKVTDLETRISLNMNVLSKGQVPNVLGIKAVLNEWLAHRKDVLVRRSEFRKQKIEHRLEILGGYLIAYLNLDEVIRIVREEDDPKAELIKAFKLTDVQAEAILNMRLRALRKLEEMEIRTEHKNLTEELKDLIALLKSDESQWKTISEEVRQTRDQFGKKTDFGARRSDFAEAVEFDLDIEEAMIEKEPVTIVLSQKGWVRALKGHQDDLSKVSYKAGDKLKFSIKAQTTDKLVLFSTDGKFFTLGVDKLPGGRGHGEPLRIMVDLEATSDIISGFIYEGGRKWLVASRGGNGFIVAEDELIANTRKGKQVLNVKTPDEAIVCTPVKGDMVAVIGENRKLLIFKLDELNEMTRGKGVRLQKYKDGGLSDLKTFDKKEGLSWVDSAGRNCGVDQLLDWEGARASAGRLPPKGFPKSNKFSPR